MISPKKGSLEEKAYEAIQSRILSLDLLPGQAVSDFKLSNDLGISRTPVREAIRMLVGEGLVTLNAKGQFVSEINREDIVELCQAREAVETMIVRMSIEGGLLTPEDLHNMRRLNDLIDQKRLNGQIFETFEVDAEFHRYPAVKCGNRRLLEEYRVLNLQMRRYRYLTLVDDQSKRLTCQEHQQILDALENRDIPAAEEAVRAHLRIVARRYSNALGRIALDDWIQIIRNFSTLEQKKHPDRQPEKQEEI